MAKNSTTLTAAEKKDLQELGWTEDNPFNVPENISPVLKSKIIEAYKKEQGLVSPLDMPNATEVGNQAARARAAEDGDKEMQAYFEDAQKNADANATEPKPDTQTARKTDTNKTENTSGLKRQGDLSK
jgi:hypothetical protein